MFEVYIFLFISNHEIMIPHLICIKNNVRIRIFFFFNIYRGSRIFCIFYDGFRILETL